MRSFQVVAGENGSPQQFNALRSDAHGSSFLLAQQMLGYFTLSTNPANGKTITITINGTAVVLNGTTGTPTNPGDFKIKGTPALTTAVILAGLQQPQTTTADFIALSGANQLLVSYLLFAAPSGGTTLFVMSNNTTLYAPLTSFSASTNATSDSFTSQPMQLYVHAGTVYVGGTRVLWTGGATPTVTAPTSHPRIDVLAIDNTGNLSWTTGTEASSPTVPIYPANEVPICELYNVVGETALYDFDDQQSGQGYIYNDVRPMIGTAVDLGDVAQDIVPDADGTRNLGSPILEFSNLYVKNGIYLNGAAFGTQITYGATAAEAIAAGAAVATGYYQSDGGNMVDVITATTVTGSSGNYSLSLTIGSHSNRVLVVFIMYRNNGGGSPSSVAFNSTGLTQLDSSVSSSFGGGGYSGILVAPATGTHNLTWTTSGVGADVACVYVASLYNCVQTGQPDAHAANFNSNAGAATSASVTPSVGAFLLTVANSSGVAGGGLGWENNGNQAGTGITMYYGDANKCFPSRPITASAGSAGTGFVLMVSVAPFTAPVLGALVNTTASNTASPFPDNFSGYRTNAAIGIAVGSASAGGTITAVINGIATGLSGLVPSFQYYLSNTGGALATTAGTVSRKIGIAITTTQLLITNLW